MFRSLVLIKFGIESFLYGCFHSIPPPYAVQGFFQQLTPSRFVLRISIWALSESRSLVCAGRFGPRDGKEVFLLWNGTHYELAQRTN